MNSISKAPDTVYSISFSNNKAIITKKNLSTIQILEKTKYQIFFEGLWKSHKNGYSFLLSEGDNKPIKILNFQQILELVDGVFTLFKEKHRKSIKELETTQMANLDSLNKSQKKIIMVIKLVLKIQKVPFPYKKIDSTSFMKEYRAFEKREMNDMSFSIENFASYILDKGSLYSSNSKGLDDKEKMELTLTTNYIKDLLDSYKKYLVRFKPIEKIFDVERNDHLVNRFYKIFGRMDLSVLKQIVSLCRIPGFVHSIDKNVITKLLKTNSFNEGDYFIRISQSRFPHLNLTVVSSNTKSKNLEVKNHLIFSLPGGFYYYEKSKEKISSSDLNDILKFINENVVVLKKPQSAFKSEYELI